MKQDSVPMPGFKLTETDSIESIISPKIKIISGIPNAYNTNNIICLVSEYERILRVDLYAKKNNKNN